MPPDRDEEMDEPVESGDDEDAETTDLTEISSKLEQNTENFKELLAQFPASQRAALGSFLSLITVDRTTSFSGPLPHPDHFKEYERARQGTSDDIIEMAKRELDIKEVAVKGAVKNDRWVISVALVSIIGLIGLSAAALYLGEVLFASLSALASAGIAAIRWVKDRNK